MKSAANQGSSGLARRLESVRERLRAAESRVGRAPGSAALLAVVKQVPDEGVRQLLDLGATELAESRVQSLLARPADLTGRARFHLIGPLQTNKVRKAVSAAAEFHALDRSGLAAHLERESAAAGRLLPVWIQVNVAAEPQKHGVDPARCGELAAEVLAAPHLRLRGLMTIPPLTGDPETSRPWFAALARLSRELRAAGAIPPDACGLSMGMSGDFEVAVEEGSTVVRIGSALFRDDFAC